MGTNAVQRGPTSDAVAANVKRLREGQNLGLRALASKLAGTGRTLTHTALDKIERGTRRVDVDDLMALAAALGVSPITLLMPPVADTDETTETTVGTVNAIRLWRWLTAEAPLTGDTASEVFAFIARSVPDGLLGTEYQLVESGLTPNRTYSVRRRDQQIAVEGHGDGDN